MTAVSPAGARTVSDDEVGAYRRNYGLGPDVGRVEVEQHRALEARLTRELLESNPDTRWETFSKAYTALYQELPWLNQPEPPPSEARLEAWRRLVPPGASIFEVGSGTAALLSFFVTLGHRCVATEITIERGSKHLAGGDGLEWHVTDGIHLAEFEEECSYDVGISTQVIEHFHPDDVAAHLANMHRILKPGGRYIFDTPHRSAGPHDLSRVFGMDSAQFMHLREYDWAELRDQCREAGFTDVAAVLRIGSFARPSRLYLRYLCLYDRVEAAIVRRSPRRRLVRRFARFALVPVNVWMVARR